MHLGSYSSIYKEEKRQKTEEERRKDVHIAYVEADVTLMISSWEPGSLMWLLSKPSLSVVALHML